MHNFDSQNIYYLKFAQCAERSSSADINPKSYHLIASELIDPPFYIYFPGFECELFGKI